MVYKFTKWWYYPLCWLFIREIIGVYNIPSKGKFIVVANHNKMLDPLLIVYPIVKKIDKKVHFIASVRWWPFLGEYICRRWAGCIPLFTPKQSYKEAKKMVNNGEIVGIFPEGRIDLDERKVKNGAIRLALETDTPILPIKVESSYFPFMSVVTVDKLLQPEGIKKEFRNPEKLMAKIYNLDLCEKLQKEFVGEKAIGSSF